MPEVRKIDRRAAQAAFRAPSLLTSAWFKLEKDDYNVPHEMRICPPVGAMPRPWVLHAMHYKNIGGTRGAFDYQGNKRAIACLEYHQGLRCPVCELGRWAKLSNLQAKVSGMFNFIEIKTGGVLIPEGERKVLQWDAPTSIIKSLDGFLEQEDYGEEVFDEKLGRNFIIMRTGNAADWSSIRYTVIPSPKVSAITLPNWNDTARDLSKETTFFTEDVIWDILEANLSGVADVAQLRHRLCGGSKPQAPKKPAASVVDTVKKARGKK
jgi:hypothetical protein